MTQAAGLHAAAQDENIWRWMPTKLYGSMEKIETWIETALRAQESGAELPFATILRETGEQVGATRYLNISRRDRGLEIGWTWLAPKAWGTGINVETKLLLLTYAFDTLGAMRVELKTDARNERSRAAILALGAEFEGIFRKHMRMPDGRIRDSAWYAMTDDDWPDVRARLTARLAAHPLPGTGADVPPR